jgi:hypothetical protein
MVAIRPTPVAVANSVPEMSGSCSMRSIATNQLVNGSDDRSITVPARIPNCWPQPAHCQRHLLASQ